MNRTALTSIAPEIFRKRLIVEGFYTRDVTGEVLRSYFEHLTGQLDLTPYGDPIIHRTSGEGRQLNEGFDAFIPLVDSGIYIAAWVNPRFLSTILYTCGPFDEDRGVELIRGYFGLEEHESAIF